MISYKISKSRIQTIVLNISLITLICFQAHIAQSQRINGISFSAPGTPNLNIEMFEQLKTTNANWVALIPEATLDRHTLNFISDDKNDCWGETIDANVKGILLAKQSGLKVFLKPHIVLGDYVKINDKTKAAEWRGTLSANSLADWKLLETNYENYILELAAIAENTGVDLFAVGTELKMFVSKRPQYWKSLIYKVKQIYNGPLTYSANWDEYEVISFWEDLDFIGVDMYFPISREKTPSVKKTIRKWKSVSKKLEKLSVSKSKKILLTEFGYRNVSYAGRQPWTHDNGAKLIPNNEAQSNLYEAIFQAFWNEPWVAGGFAWKWFAHPKQTLDTTFSVQGKPALSVIQKWYGAESKTQSITSSSQGH